MSSKKKAPAEPAAEAPIQLFAGEDKEREALADIDQVAQQLVLELEGGEGILPFSITSEETFLLACDMLEHVKKEYKALDARRKTVTQPMHQALEAFRDLYRPTLKRYKKAEELLSGWVNVYVTKKQAEKEEAARAVAELAAEGNFEAAMAVSNETKPLPEHKGIIFQSYWDYEVEDIRIVPEAYIVRSINEEMMKRHIKHFGKDKPAPLSGIRFVRVDKAKASGK